MDLARDSASLQVMVALADVATGAAATAVELQLSAAEGPDVYDVVAIDAGSGNGWVFSPDVVEASLPLWGRLNVYLGHASQQQRGPNGERQPPDLAGVF